MPWRLTVREGFTCCRGCAFAGSGLSTEVDGDPGRAITLTPLNRRRRLEG
ncbi:hypothetical protein OIE75_10390 [Streptomyces sp. NBC_01723]|nr:MULTISPECIES: hypothetical protein [unclassified Streptomyces]MDQ0403405.1 hypothetical protein [Streptomyces sp. DSM 40167]